MRSVISWDLDDAATVCRLRQLMAVATGLLVALTWPLWTPGGEFPDIPWSRAFGEAVPDPLDWVSLAALGGLLILQFVRLPEHRRWPTAVQGGLFCVAMLLLPADQHRLQPWVWQMVVAAVVIGVSSDSGVTLSCLRMFTVSIYFWSGVSKVDWAFVTGQGQWLLEGLAGAVGLSPAWWTQPVRFTLAGLFPAWELVTALALLWPRTRRVGLGMSIVMHVLLLGALGPLGHRQLPGVLVWNVYFIVQNVLLFGRSTRLLVLRNRKRGCGAWAARLVTGAVCMLPALSPWGYWDHWPSWAVYSARPCVVEVSVRSDEVGRLPTTLQAFVGPPEPLSDWYPVNLDAWSFATCRAPMYPQKRYRLAVISALAVKHQSAPRIIIRSSPNRWTGQRSVEEIRTMQEDEP